MDEIKAGDTVELKSGGVTMTVEWVEDGSANCVWQDGNKPMNQVYNLVVLKKYDRSADAAAFRARRG